MRRGFMGWILIDWICLDCLANGELRKLDIFTCEGDVEALHEQLTALHPTASAEQIEAWAQEKTEELERTTPHLVTYQDWPWPAADGDYCQFVAYGSKAFFNGRAADGDGKILFLDFLQNADEVEDVEELWAEDLPDKAINTYSETGSYPALFYVFQSLHSSRLLTVWDME